MIRVQLSIPLKIQISKKPLLSLGTLFDGSCKNFYICTGVLRLAASKRTVLNLNFSFLLEISVETDKTINFTTRIDSHATNPRLGCKSDFNKMRTAEVAKDTPTRIK